MKVKWNLRPKEEIEEFLAVGRPVQGWPLLRSKSHFSTLTAVIDPPDDARHANNDQYDVSDLDLSPQSADCVFIILHHFNNTDWYHTIGTYLHRESIIFIFKAGSLRLDISTNIQEGFSTVGFSIVTMRQIFSTGNGIYCGESVLRIGEATIRDDNNLDDDSLTKGKMYSFLQLQYKPPTPGEVSSSSSSRLTAMINDSLYLDQYPSPPHEALSPEDVEYLCPPLASTPHFLHLSNFYSWRQIYPELQILLDNFDVIQKEVTAISLERWTPWPEYHFRNGGEDNDWRVIPFLHTFPANEPSKCVWIASTGEKFPETVRLLKTLPRLRTALLSKLGPGTRLSAHTGWDDLANFVLRTHLTLSAPSGEGGEATVGSCGVWVEGEIRTHRVKEFIVFDDSKVHKAFNLHKEQSRVVLILDLIRPSDIAQGVAVGGHTEQLDEFISAFR